MGERRPALSWAKGREGAGESLGRKQETGLGKQRGRKGAGEGKFKS